MAKQIVNVGATPNDRDADSIRVAFSKINQNFTELYDSLGLNDLELNLGAFEFNGSIMTTTDSSAVTIDQATTVTSDLTVGGDVVPNVANGGDLGSLAKPWRSLYVSSSTVYFDGVPVSLDAGTNELKINNVPISQTITYADISNAPAAFSGSYADLTNKPTIPTDVSDLTDTTNLFFDRSYNSLTDTPTIPVDIGDLTDTGNLLGPGSELVGTTVAAVGGTASANETGITYSNKIAIFTEGAFTVGVWTDVQIGWTVTDNNGFTDTIASRGGFGAASFVTTVNNWPAPASGKTYVFTSPDYQPASVSPVEITVGNNDWLFNNNGSVTFPDATVQTTAYTGPQTSLDGDVTGSVFSDGSTLLVDGVAGKIVGDVETARLRTSETAIALGGGAGETTQGVRAVAIGDEAGRTDQGVRAVAIGYYAGQTNQSATAVAIGDEAGNTNQGVRAVAVGYLAGGADQGTDAVAIGDEAGRTSQGDRAVAIGCEAGRTSQGDRAVAMGHLAGTTSQGVGGVAIGEQAGQTSQGVLSVAIGYYAGANTQSFSAVAIGAQAGETAQGAGAIAIGDLAGQTAQGNNSIVINATGVALNNTVANTFVVKPIRAAAGTSILQYDASTGEISHTNDIYSDQQISITVAGEDSTSKTWYFGNDGDLTAPGDITLNGVVKHSTIEKTGGANSGTATALDLAKSVQVLVSADTNDDSWSLADGVEGQIMYFVPKGAGLNNHYINIANVRYFSEGGYTVGPKTWIPFQIDDNLRAEDWRSLAVAVFTDGAWNTDTSWFD